jgi:ribosomal protein L13
MTHQEQQRLIRRTTIIDAANGIAGKILSTVSMRT